MAFDPGSSIADSNVGDLPAAPRMLRQPVDLPAPPEFARDLESVRVLRQAWQHQLEMSGRSLLRSPRAWAGRITGRSDRHLNLALASALDALASHCDHLVDRLASQDARTADIAGAFGEEITRLRAQVMHLQGNLDKSDRPRNE
jgi:hypothetical protein